MLIVIATAFLLGGLLVGWQVRHPPLERGFRPQPSSRWYTAAAAALLLLCGVVLVVLGAWPGGQAGIWLIYLMLAAPGVLLVGGAVVAWRERRQTRVHRRELGQPALRRRVHWAVASGAWMFLSIFAWGAALEIAVIGFGYRSDSRPTDASMMALLVWVIGGMVVVGLLQAWRRRRRDREIQDLDMPSLAEGLIEDSRPPTWMPSIVGDWWKDLNKTLDAPVQAGTERVVVIGGAVLLGLWAFFFGGSFIATIASPEPPAFVKGFFSFVLILVAFAIFNVIMRGTPGLRTATRAILRNRGAGEDGEGPSAAGPP